MPKSRVQQRIDSLRLNKQIQSSTSKLVNMIMEKEISYPQETKNILKKDSNYDNNRTK